ncbi:MAG: [acyl-carrier-protein] S-malonyltransferase [Planctomycetota bacterium]|jgi:[acyl-carrier-protein] S-malonyltransferase
MRALLFPGQGAQYVGMASDIAAACTSARELLLQAEKELGIPLGTIMAQGPEADLTRTDISQPAILVHSLMAMELLREQGKLPAYTATAGLSLGEYTALVAAGALPALEAVKLVRLRGQAMQAAAEATPGGMVVLIGPDEATAQKLCDAAAEGDVLVVANLNAPGQVVLAGAKPACERAIAKAKDFGIRRAMALGVAGAFHSPHMAPAAERLKAALVACPLRDPKVPVYTNVHAGPVRSATEIPDLLVRQLTSPVRWADSVARMHADGITEALELGPGKTLCGMAARIAPALACRNVDKAADAG